MKTSKSWLCLIRAWPLMAGFVLFAPFAQAQEDDDEESVEEITVTGSRIARDEFSTTTPIQVLNTEAAQRIGIISISELLQKSTASSGQQIDGSISTNAGQTNASEAPADGGVGSACINLRGLGCERTLVLVQGKRLGLAGIRGAPPQPDINMIPIGMVEGVDLLTGGLSTVYGADAVAGVVNVRLKKDFEGLNFTVNTDIPNDEGGEIYQASMVGGVSSDLGNVTFGIEYSRQERVRTGDRSYSSCLRRGTSGISIARDGVTQVLNCRSDFPDNWMTTLGTNGFAHDAVTGLPDFANSELVPIDGTPTHSVDATRLIYTPGTSNIMWGALGLDPGEPVTGFSLFSSLPDANSPTLAQFPSGSNGSRPFALDRFRYDPSTNDQLDRADADLWRPYERFSLVMNGHLDPGWGNNSELYFEGYYFNRQNRVIGAREQIFPGVPGEIPLVTSTNNLIFFDPNTGTSVGPAGIAGTVPSPVDATSGQLGVADNPMNPFSFSVNPVLTLDTIPQTFDVELQQIRLVTGVTGDLPFSDNWGYDVSVSYDRSTGFAAQEILLENNLFLATQNLGNVAAQATCSGQRTGKNGGTRDGTCGSGQADGDPRFVLVRDTDPTSATYRHWIAGGQPVWSSNPAGTGQVVCDMRFLAPGGFITPEPCVPFNIFDMAVAGDGVTSSGKFGTRKERNYLMGNRTNRTVTELTVFSAFLTGDLYEMPNGEAVGSAFGIEYREDKIDSQNDAIGVHGHNAAENPLQEGETRGKRDTFDLYGEISAPLVVDASWAELLQLDAAIRFTDDENFGNETVYKIGGLWRINEYVAFSSAFNTSFRAPNLREQFLADQAGALPGGNDPCHSQVIALATPGPALDRLLANCVLSGADTNLLGSAFTVAIPTSTGGAAGLSPETSESLTATLTLNQPWFDSFDFDLALTYWDITIEDTVRALDPDTIVSRCYNDQPNLASPFCARVFRDRANATPLNNFISFVRAGFVNTGEETATGYDITTRFNMEFDSFMLNWSTATTFLDERTSQEFPPSEADSDGSAIVDDVGRIGNPEWTFQSTVGATFGNWDVVWQSRYWSTTEFAEGLPNPIVTDKFGRCLHGCPRGDDPATFFDDDGFTDYGFALSSQIPTSIGQTRPVTSAEGQWHHDLGISYNFENASITAGINNITDEEPPLISQEAGPNRNNAVASARYDLIGTSYFLNLTVGF